jgi:hypothetical protein
MKYAASLAKKAPKDVVAVFADVLGDGRFTRDHSGTDEFEIFDRFLQSAEPQWRPYALVRIQMKRRATRDERYEKWAGEGEGVATVAAMLRREQIKWGRL